MLCLCLILVILEHIKVYVPQTLHFYFFLQYSIIEVKNKSDQKQNNVVIISKNTLHPNKKKMFIHLHLCESARKQKQLNDE